VDTERQTDKPESKDLKRRRFGKEARIRKGL
jgi:hypothetical protein